MTTLNTSTIKTQQNDTIDLICWRIFGEKMNDSRVVEQVLALNHGLADSGPVLPCGLDLIVPVLTTTQAMQEVIQLWT